MRLADLAKAAAGLERSAPASRPKVVIAQRRHTRVLTNAVELAAALAAAGIEATVHEFGTMTFADQVRRAAYLYMYGCWTASNDKLFAYRCGMRCRIAAVSSNLCMAAPGGA